MSRRALELLVVVSMVLGLALMIAFEATVTRVAGVACLLAFVVGGLFLVADPDFLAGDDS